MKTSRIMAGRAVLFVLVGLGFAPAGYTNAESTPDPATKEKEFLSDPNVVTAVLEKTTIDSLDFIKRRPPSFVYRMKRNGRKELRHARLTIADQPLRILLGERLEREFYLFDEKAQFGPYWWGSWNLNSYHKIGGKFFEFILVEDGKKITGRPYNGEFGILKLGKGGRDLEKAEFSGSVYQAGYVSAPIGAFEKDGTIKMHECRIPVGDYTAYYLSVKYDNLAISVSNNYHANAKGQPRGNREVVYGMKVRKDKPYVLDFSNKPMVIFDRPHPSERSFSRGQEIKFAAVMIDPDLDIMIRRLYDESVQVEKETSSGHKYKRSKSLDPKVVITRADGEIVAEGVMPFG